jgi:hypothetical protein
MAPAAPAHMPAALSEGSDQWKKELVEWLDSFPQDPVSHEEALKRENWLNPTGGNPGEDEDSRRYEYSAPGNSTREPALRRCEDGIEVIAPAEPPALRYASEREGILERMHSSDRS